ncbi:MAG: hypothetical protein EOO53_02660 [Gammaproteobacteria bacterium]|nr:MAG: hypothetical protein EOO53_02660 [Gammaproteobacteria bacterium]
MKPPILLSIAHWSMTITFVLVLFTVFIIYGADLALSIPVLVFLHIFLVLMAAIFKVSYVARLTALQQLGREAH